jgi:transcriptional regulator with XRE-family HTH domain
MRMFTGPEIRELRAALGLTMKQLGARLGVAESTVSLWEASKRHPRFETLVKLNELAAGPAKPTARR